MEAARFNAVAGWYADPERPGLQRWWNGAAWADQYQPIQYQAQPAMVYPAYAQPTNGMAVTALVLGLVGTVLGFIPILFWLAWGLGIPALILGMVAVRRANALGGVRRTMAVWGVVVGVTATIMGCVGYAVLQNIFTTAQNDLNKTSQQLDRQSQCLQQANTPAEIQACTQ